MGVNVLGPKWVRKLQEMTGKPIDRAVVFSHHDSGRWADARWINEDGTCSHILVHRQTGETAEHDGTHWSSCPPRPKENL